MLRPAFWSQTQQLYCWVSYLTSSGCALHICKTTYVNNIAVSGKIVGEGGLEQGAQLRGYCNSLGEILHINCNSQLFNVFALTGWVVMDGIINKWRRNSGRPVSPRIALIGSSVIGIFLILQIISTILCVFCSIDESVTLD